MMTRWWIGAAIGAAGALCAIEAAAAPKVTATIAPVHSLVARVMAGVAEPRLLIQPGASPHHYAMRPSEAAALADAEVVFWVGPELERWLAAPIETLAGDAVSVELGGIDGLTLLPRREGGAWERHGHDHDRGDADAETAHAPHAGDRSDHDPHLWLDPENARAMLSAIAERLAGADPENAGRYRANAEAGRAELAALIEETRAALAPVADEPFIVFHDAYHYFEERFGLGAVGAIALSEADPPGPARVLAIRERLQESGAVCVFTEPQFTSKLARAVVAGTDARLGALDPVGAGLEPGADLYPALIRTLAASLADCLGGG